MGVNGIYGLSGSGLDVESLVKVGMMSKQSEYDKLYQKTVKQQWTKEALADIYSDLTTFKYTTLSGFKSQSKLNAMAATTTDSTAVTATANGAAIAMNHKVEVTGLSSNAYWLTDGTITREGKADSIKLSDNLFKDIQYDAEASKKASEEEQREVEIYTYTTSEPEMEDDGNGGQKVKTDEEGNTIYKKVQVRGDDIAIKFTVSDSDAVLSPEDKTKDSQTVLTDDEKKKQTITYTFKDLANGKTYNDIAADVNAMGTNVKASYDSVTDSFTFYNSVSGKESGIKLLLADEDTTTEHNGGTFAAKLLNNLNLKKSVLGEDGAPELEELGKFVAGDALDSYGNTGSVKIDGKEYTNVQDNRITVSGVTYNLLNAEVGKTTTISVSQDTDAIIDTVKSFVEEYNKVLDKLQEKYSTKTWSTDDLDNDYEPLTKTQQAGMTADQIESWNEKAKSGLLYHNSMIRDLINDMRDAISTRVTSVNSEYNSASAIGITSSDNKGHLTLDEDKLKKALAADPDCVYQIFANDQDNYTDLDPNKRYDYIKSEDYNARGIVNRLYYDAVTDGMDTLAKYSGTSADVNDETTLGKAIVSLQNRLDTLKTRLSDYQTMLFKKYDAMERAIANQNALFGAIFGGNS